MNWGIIRKIVEVYRIRFIVEEIVVYIGDVYKREVVFFFKQKTAYEIGVRLVGSEMCIRDSCYICYISKELSDSWQRRAEQDKFRAVSNQQFRGRYA